MNQLHTYRYQTMYAKTLNLLPVLMMCEFWAGHNLSKVNAAYNWITEQVVAVKPNRKNTKLTICIDDVPVLTESVSVKQM